MIEFIILFIAGLVAGSYGSLVGGGSLVSFPVLILLGFPVDVAVGTNRFNAIFMEGSSMIAFARKKLVQWQYAIPIGIISIPASVLGAQLVIQVPKSVANVFVAVTLVLLLFSLLYIKPREQNKEKTHEPKNIALLVVSCLVLAVYAGFYGAAYGTFILFPFLLFAGSSLLQSSANARTVGFLVSIAASVVFIINGDVAYEAAIPAILGNIIGAQIGVHYAVTKGTKIIKYVLGAVALASAVKLIFELL